MAERPTPPPAGRALVYVTGWSPYCAQLRAGLDALSVPYDVVDVDGDRAAARFVESVNGGNRVVPTVVLPDGSTLTNPPAETVASRLGR